MLYLGKVVYTVDTEFVATLQSVSGQTLDICATLS
jgi:hypothetical protein